MIAAATECLNNDGCYELFARRREKYGMSVTPSVHGGVGGGSSFIGRSVEPPWLMRV